MIIVSKENEICCNTLVNEYFEPIRKEIHNRFGPGADWISNIFAYTDQEDNTDEFEDNNDHQDNNMVVADDIKDRGDMVTNDITLRVTDNTEGSRKVVIKDRRNAIIEDRRNRVSQFDLAVVKIGQNGALTAFDNASIATLLDENFVKENNLKITRNG